MRVILYVRKGIGGGTTAPGGQLTTSSICTNTASTKTRKPPRATSPNTPEGSPHRTTNPMAEVFCVYPETHQTRTQSPTSPDVELPKEDKEQAVIGEASQYKYLIKWTACAPCRARCGWC
ncbi:hypothetical protein ILYODFUR_028288 [Ilyodon furcidens]|uniref:Uncharacterized protein n=1 Tax=Ilyodon furcidens TaxID=33524 RepID=A0ABV0SRN3_9TELE